MSREYYTVFWDDCEGVTYETKEQAIEDITINLTQMFDDLPDGDTGNFKIKVVEMTPEEFAALPEFDGY